MFPCFPPPLQPSHGACAGVGSVEAMVVVKGRWGDDEEVSMDVDVTEEDERGFLSEISLTRGAVQYLAMPSFLPDGSISMSAAFSQPVRHCCAACDTDDCSLSLSLCCRRGCTLSWIRTCCWHTFSSSWS